MIIPTRYYTGNILCQGAAGWRGMSDSLQRHSTPHGHPYARQSGWTNVWMHHLARGLTYARRNGCHAPRVRTPTFTPFHTNMLTQLYERLHARMHGTTVFTHARTPSRLHALPPALSRPRLRRSTHSRGGGAGRA